jgi:hypothetical protein
LSSDFSAWKAKGKTIEGIIGIDHLGTSRQALEFALATFDRVFVTHLGKSCGLQVTFHPKLYLFYGEKRATCFYGSHNLTVGGTETNYEGGVKIVFDRPDDQDAFAEALDCWESLLPENGASTRLLDDQLLEDLSSKGLLLDENKASRPKIAVLTGSSPVTVPSTMMFPPMRVRPPSALPKPTNTSSNQRDGSSAGVAPISPTSGTFVIQIIPHTNGEVHLSKIAIDQNQSFFGFPFTGMTTPKKPSNRPYRQRTPDPHVDIRVYDANGNLALQKDDFPLNTVYYDDNSELRVTFSPDLVRIIPSYSIMVMVKNPALTTVDYDISIFVPGSQQFHDYLAVCNQTMPSGGKNQPRKMGWL